MTFSKSSELPRYTQSGSDLSSINSAGFPRRRLHVLVLAVRLGQDTNSRKKHHVALSGRTSLQTIVKGRGIDKPAMPNKVVLAFRT